MRASTVIVLVVLAFVAWLLRSTLLLLFAGWLAGIGLCAIAGFIRRVMHIPWVASVWVSVVLAFAAVVLAVSFAGPPIALQAAQLRDLFGPAASKVLAEIDATPLMPYAAAIASRTAQALNDATAILVALFGGAFVAIAGALEPDLYRRGFLSLVPPSYRERTNEALHRTLATLRLWLFARILSMVTTGALVWVGLLILHVPLAGALSVLAAVLAFVPNIGAFIAALPAVVLAFAQNPRLAAAVVVMYVIVHILDDFIVAPLLERRIVRLPPILTLAAQIALGLGAGALGLMLAAPLVAAVLALVRVLWVEPLELRRASHREAYVPDVVRVREAADSVNTD